MKNRNINQTLKEKMDSLAAIKFRKIKTLIRKMKKNHLEFHWSPQKENKSKVHATKETIKVMAVENKEEVKETKSVDQNL